MKPIFALVGRSNVGKSTLFNRLTSSRAALVSNVPGLTRDRHYGIAWIGPSSCIVVDTGGFEFSKNKDMQLQIAHQACQAIEESDVVLFIVDGREGLNTADLEIAVYLRTTGRPVLLAVNKTEGMNSNVVASEFFELGFGNPIVISATHGNGIVGLVTEALKIACVNTHVMIDDHAINTYEKKVAIVGRQNVGKSTLLNTLVGKERVIALDIPGTTRDSIYVDLKWKDCGYTFIDTAGLRKRRKVLDTIEKFSMMKTLRAINDSNVTILLLDACQDITDQDMHIASFIIEQGRALVIGINKWENVEKHIRASIKTAFTRKLKFIKFARFNFISAITGTGIDQLMDSVDTAYSSAMVKIATPKLTRALIEAVKFQQPRRFGSIRPKLRYAHQGGRNPPTVVVHGNSVNVITDSYKRYLEKYFRETFNLEGTPLRIEFRASHNPYTEIRK